MGDYHTLARRTMEIILPEGHSIPPEGCIIPPEGRRRPQVEAARQYPLSRGPEQLYNPNCTAFCLLSMIGPPIL